MPYCRKCGAEIAEGAEFCPKCGTSGAEYGKAEWRGPRNECFGWERGGEFWGTVAIGVFLVGLAILFYLDSIGVISWWPGILFLIGIMIIISGIISYARGGRRARRSTPSA
ncbi:MAG: zinc-ribbon domain-containing protein [Nitrososphaerales archaeon]|nr:zinc-ribbon domain-containing protein [Nitrososphaerales archaeon]